MFLKRIFHRHIIRLLLNLSGSLLILWSLFGSLWFDIVNFKAEVDGQSAEVRVRGGLFKVCYPAFEVAENGTLLVLGGEQCSSLAEISGVKITRAVKLSNGCIVVGFFVGVMMLICQLRMRLRDHPFLAEGFLVGFGLNMAAASIALATVTSTGILVCNCSDEFGRDGWINMAGTNLILICFFVSKTKLKNAEFRHRGVWFLYEFISFFAVMLIVFSAPSTIHDTSKFDSAPSNFYLSDFNQTTTPTTTTTTTATTTTTTNKWPFPSSPSTTTRPKPTLPSLSFPTLPGRTLERCQKR